MSADPYAPLRDAASAAARNLGLTSPLNGLAPEHWQRALAAVETRMRMRGTRLPEGWREELSVQMSRNDPDAFTGPES